MSHPRVSELLVGGSQVIRDLREAVCRAARRNIPVLIQGPTGAGKELVAQGLHVESGRSGRFVAFNAAAISEELFESEVMGHVRGAFTGAVRNRAGFLRSASHGTAFMDEIGDLSLAAQAKVLRVLDTREVCAVGSDVAEQVDFRLITATNVDLAAATHAGRFRIDLLFRLRGIVIVVPPLRDHVEDIAELSAHFARAMAIESGETEFALTRSAIRVLETYAWPGNVRELRQTLEHAAFLAEGSNIGECDVTGALTAALGSGWVTRADSSERGNLRELLSLHGGDVNAAARVLGIDRSTAYRRIQRLGLSASIRGRRAAVPATGISMIAEDATSSRS